MWSQFKIADLITIADKVRKEAGIVYPVDTISP
jgi:hypothetical protein